MSEANDLLPRLSNCETDLIAHRGYMKALEYGLRAMIITHPNPAQLARVWKLMLPGIADMHEANKEPVFTASFQQLLASLGDQIETAAAKS